MRQFTGESVGPGNRLFEDSAINPSGHSQSTSVEDAWFRNESDGVPTANKDDYLGEGIYLSNSEYNYNNYSPAKPSQAQPSQARDNRGLFRG